MNIKKFKHSEQLYAILFWIVLLLILILGIYLNSRCQTLPMFEGTVSYRESNWRFGEKGKDLHPITLHDQITFEPGVVYVLTTDLSYDGSHDSYPSVFLFTGNIEVELYLHGESAFRHSHADKVFKRIQSVGGCCVSLPLQKDCLGKNIRVELRNPMNHPVTHRLPGIIFGDHESQIRHVFLKCLPSMLLSSAITFAVMILVLLGNTVDGTQWTYIYFSLFAVFIVFYRAMQELFLLYIWAKPFMAQFCGLFSLVACPIPLLMSYRYRVKPHFLTQFNLLIAASIAILIGQCFLHFTGILDVTDMEVFTHVWALIVAVSMFILGVKVKKKTGQKQVLRKLVPILLGACVEAIHYYFHKLVPFSPEHYSTGDFIGLGLLVSLILMIWEARRGRIEAAKELERNLVLEKVAYTDALTGINNRAAFTRELAKIASGKTAGIPILVVSADLNGLKQANDKMGHIAGDQLIRKAAEVLKESLSSWGQVYRTGGDEFFSLLTGVEESAWPQIQNVLDQKIAEINEREHMTLSIAVGVAQLQDGDINGAIQLSDRRMYQQKEAQHKIMPDI